MSDGSGISQVLKSTELGLHEEVVELNEHETKGNNFLFVKQDSDEMNKPQSFRILKGSGAGLLTTVYQNTGQTSVKGEMP